MNLLPGSVALTRRRHHTLILITFAVLVTVGFGLCVTSASAQSAVNELSPKAKLERLVDHKQFEPQFNTCAQATERCAALLQLIANDNVEFIRPFEVGKSARRTLKKMCGSRYLAFYQEDPHTGSSFGPVITAKGLVTLYRLPDLAKKFPGRKLYLVRTEDDVQLGKPYDDGRLYVFSMPGCRRIGGQILQKSKRYSDEVPTALGRNDWMAEPIIVGDQVFLLGVYSDYGQQAFNLRLVSALGIQRGPGEDYVFFSK